MKNNNNCNIDELLSTVDYMIDEKICPLERKLYQQVRELEKTNFLINQSQQRLDKLERKLKRTKAKIVPNDFVSEE